MNDFTDKEVAEMLAVFSGFSSPIKVSISDKLEEEIERRKELSDLDFEDCDVYKLWGRAQIAMLKNLLLILAYKKSIAEYVVYIRTGNWKTVKRRQSAITDKKRR